MNENNLLKEQMEKFDEIKNENIVLKEKLKEVQDEMKKLLNS